MNMEEALSLACEVLEVRRQQWAAVTYMQAIDAPELSDCISELYEATPEEAAAMVRILDDAAATLDDERQKYAPGGE